MLHSGVKCIGRGKCCRLDGVGSTSPALQMSRLSPVFLKKSWLMAINCHNEFSLFVSMHDVNIDIILCIPQTCLNLIVCNNINVVFEMFSLADGTRRRAWPAPRRTGPRPGGWSVSKQIDRPHIGRQPVLRWEAGAEHDGWPALWMKGPNRSISK